MEYDMYAVGQRRQEWVFPGRDVVIQIDFDGAKWNLLVGYPNIMQQEIEEIRDKDVSMAFSVINNMLFFMFKFREIPWCDTPYEPRLHESPTPYPDLTEPGTGAPLAIFIIDSAIGELKALRVMGMGHMQSNNLYALCRELDSRRPLDEAKYRWNLEKVYKKYKSSSDMLKTVSPENIFLLVKSPNNFPSNPS